MKKLIIAILIPYLITGCATTYHQKNLFGGYSDQKFEKDVYQVGFDASLFTNSDVIEQYIQYRSAEIVVEKGYQFYTIIENYTPAHSITIKIYEERPEDIEVRDANEVIANLKDVVNWKHWSPKKLSKQQKVIAGATILISWYIYHVTCMPQYGKDNCYPF